MEVTTKAEELFHKPLHLALFMNYMLEACESTPVMHQLLFVINEEQYSAGTSTRDAGDLNRLFLEENGYLYVDIEPTDEVAHVELSRIQKVLNDEIEVPEGGLQMLFGTIKKHLIDNYLAIMIEQWHATLSTKGLSTELIEMLSRFSSPENTTTVLSEAEKEAVKGPIMMVLEEKVNQHDQEKDDHKKEYLAILLGLVIEYYTELALPPLTLSRFQVLVRRADSKRNQRRANGVSQIGRKINGMGSMMLKGHNFVRTHHNEPVYCNACTNLLWGLGMQGYECMDCRVRIHKDKKCIEMVSSCKADKHDFDTSDYYSEYYNCAPTSPPARSPSTPSSPSSLGRGRGSAVMEKNKMRWAEKAADKAERMAGERPFRPTSPLQNPEPVYDSDDNSVSPISPTSVMSPVVPRENHHRPSLGNTSPVLGRSKSVKSTLSLEALIMASPARLHERWDTYVNEDVMRTVEAQGPKAVERQQIIFGRGWGPELIRTEYNYVRNMIAFKEVFEDPLLAANTPNFTRIRMQSIFANTEDIIQVNLRFLNKLTERQLEDPIVENISDLFDEFDTFKVYAIFCPNATLAEDIIKEEKKHYSFLKMVQDGETNPRCNRQKIESFLVLPMQRFTRYPLLLEDILKKTPDGHPDKEPLKEVLRKIKSILGTINARMGAIKNAYALRKLQKRLEMRDGWCVDVSDKVRSILYEGPLKVTQIKQVDRPDNDPENKIRKTLEGSKVHAILLTDILLLTCPKGDRLQLYMQPIQLTQVIVRDETSSISEHKAFYVINNDTTSMQQFLAYSQAEKEKWISVIDEAVKEALKKKDEENKEKALEKQRLLEQGLLEANELSGEASP